MNITLPFLIAFLLLLPGLIFSAVYLSAQGVSHLSYRNSLSHRTISVTLSAFVLQIIGLYIVYLLTGYTANLQAVLAFLASPTSDPTYKAALTALLHHEHLVVFYFFFLYLGSWLLAFLLRWLVIRYRLYNKLSKNNIFYSFFNIVNPWIRLFTGQLWEDDSNVDIIHVAAIVEFTNKSYLYMGFVENYFLDHKGDLDRIILAGAMRRALSNDKILDESDTNTNRFYSIDGDYFVLRADEIKTLNFHGLRIESLEQKNH